jgi:WD40 repeat protein
MKTNSFIVSFVLLVVLIISCKNQPKSNDFTAESIQDTFHLRNGKVYKNDSLLIGNPVCLKFHPDSFLIFEDVNTTDLIKIVDLKTNRIQEIIKQGRGPGELISVWNIDIVGNDAYIFCGQLRKLIVLSVDDNRHFVISREINLEENKTIRFCPLTKDLFACLSNYDVKERITYLNNNGKIIKRFGDYPKLEQDFEGNNYIFQGNFAANPSGDKFALACGRTDVIEIYESDKGLYKRFQGPIGIHLEITGKNLAVGSTFNFNPSYVTYGGGIANNEEFWFCYVGYNLRSSSSTKRSFYDTFPKEILCFDWNGKPLRKISFDNPFTGFDVDWNKKVLYLLEIRDSQTKIVSYSF